MLLSKNRLIGLGLSGCMVAVLTLVFANAPVKKQPRYVPGVVSIIEDHAYIRAHEAPVYWKISPYYLSQPTDASCSLTTATMVINALRIPQMKYADQKLATTDTVVHSIGNDSWANDVKQGGNGVTLDKLGRYLSHAMDAYHIPSFKLEVVHATQPNDVAAKFNQALVESEKTGKTFLIVNYNQKFISGTEDVGHFAPVGAYDSNTKRVLIMDPDRELFEPYWVPEQRLLDGMATKDSDSGKNRGFVVVTLE